MKNTNLINSLIISTCVLLFAVICVLMYAFLPFWVFKPASKSSITYNKTNNSIVSTKNEITILQLTDFHINGVIDMPVTYSMIKRLIYKTEPDLLYLSGDIFSGGSSKKDVETFFNFIERFKLPWLTVFGNHDDETPYSMKELSTKFENANYSLFKTGDLSNLYGNYYYNVTFADNNKFQFIFLDTRHYGFTEESVTFYENVVNSSKQINNNVLLNNILFYHIPLSTQVLVTEEYNKNPSIGTGHINEIPSSQETEVGFYNKILELGTTKAMIFGHDHINNAKIKYDGINFCYGTKTGPSAYNDTFIQGGTVYTLNSSGEFTYKDIYLI